MTVEEIIQGKNRAQLGEIIIELHKQMEADTEAHVKAQDKIYKANKKQGLAEERINQLECELETAERKLKVVEEASRAGLAMLYPDAPIPSRHSDQFGYQEGMALRVQGLEPKPEERLLVHILQEAI